MKRILIITFMVLVLAGCGSVGGEAVQNDGQSTMLYREIDQEAGVVCWHFGQNGNIDCLPISETKLR